MIDSRHLSFIKVYELGSYTKASQELFLTQPAITQHIQYLEKQYKCKLFIYNKRQLKASEQGKLLYDYTKKILADNIHMEELITNYEERKNLIFGATLSIGEYLMRDIIKNILAKNKDIKINMRIENTESLLKKLEGGEIFFALIEGFFDKNKYSYKTLKKEHFIGICSNDSKLKNGVFELKELFNEKLILREKGSGTREIFETYLSKQNFSIYSFENICEIGSLNLIKNLVLDNLGISFMYKICVQDEVENKKISQINIRDFDLFHEFNFVYLKNSIHEKEYLDFFSYLKTL